MFELYTENARRVVVLSQEEARRLNHNYIGTEHLLLGLIARRKGVAMQALISFGFDLEATRLRVEEVVGTGRTTPETQIPFTPRAKKALELGYRESLERGVDYIGTEHLLLGLVREKEGTACRIITSRGVNLSSLRQRVTDILSADNKRRVTVQIDPNTRKGVLLRASNIKGFLGGHEPEPLQPLLKQIRTHKDGQISLTAGEFTQAQLWYKECKEGLCRWDTTEEPWETHPFAQLFEVIEKALDQAAGA